MLNCWAAAARKQHSTTNKWTKLYKLEEICQNSSWEPNRANFKYYLWYTPIEDGRETRRKTADWRCNFEARDDDGQPGNEGKRHFVSCRAREKHKLPPGLLTYSQSVDTPTLYFLSLSFASACEGVLSFYCARTWHWSFCVFARAYFWCWLTKP